MQGNPDRSKNIFRVEVSCSYVEKRWSESILPAKRPNDGSYLLLNGLPWRVCVLRDAGHDNLIEPVMNIPRGYQIPHRRLQRFVPHPMLNRAHVEARS
jgi:hypothetical protein